MKVGMIAPVAWRTPPAHYGPWERVTSLITEGLVSHGVDVTLFATADSKTSAKLHSAVSSGYEENSNADAKVWEYLHLSEIFEQAEQFDILHNNFDFMPLAYSQLVKTPMLTTIHGFSSPKILPVYEKYNQKTYYVSISNADRAESLDYIDTVYHGIDIENFDFNDRSADYLIFFGRVHPDKGTKEAIEIAKLTKRRLIIAGIIQDQNYYEKYIAPEIDGDMIQYIGSVGPDARNHYLRNAYALLHPIHFKEPFGLSVVEAMACGTPVIASPLGSMPELIQNGENGYLASNLEEFAESVENISQISRLECRQYVESRFTVDIMVEKYIALYKRIIDYD